MAHTGRWRELAGSRVLSAGLASWRNWPAALAARIPSDCALCRGSARGDQLCPDCRADVTHSMQSPVRRCPVCRLALETAAGCPDCALRAPAFDGVVAAFDYAMPGDLLVRQFKAERRFSHARMLAVVLADAVLRHRPALPGNTILVPVPASRASVLQRGFNPAAELARYLAPQLALRCHPHLLVRHQEGGRQTHMRRAQRLRQAPGLYACTRPIEGATVAVVDDVLTTGSTLHGIAVQLKAAGADAVWGLVLARTPYRQRTPLIF